MRGQCGAQFGRELRLGFQRSSAERGGQRIEIAILRKGRLWRIPTAGQGKISCTGCLHGGHGEKGINKSRRKPI